MSREDTNQHDCMNALYERLRKDVLTAQGPSDNTTPIVKIEAVLKLCSELFRGELAKMPKSSCPKWLPREVALVIEEGHHYLVKMALSKDVLSYNVERVISLIGGASDDDDDERPAPAAKPSAKSPVDKKSKQSKQSQQSKKELRTMSTRSSLCAARYQL